MAVLSLATTLRHALQAAWSCSICEPDSYGVSARYSVQDRTEIFKPTDYDMFTPAVAPVQCKLPST